MVTDTRQTERGKEEERETEGEGGSEGGSPRANPPRLEVLLGSWRKDRNLRQLLGDPPPWFEIFFLI